MYFILRRYVAVVLLLMLMPGLGAQETDEGGRPRRPVPRIAEAPVVDGNPDDPVWSQASVIDGLTEVVPHEGAPGSPPTRILLMRSDTYLYIAFICFEPHPEKLVLHDMHRDALQREDDAVKITLDTFRDGKSGYYFLIDAAGSRLDAIVSNNGQQVNYRWDGFWEGGAQIFKDRWTAEFAIPFQTMSFSEDTVWRANFERWSGVDRRLMRWTGAKRNYRVTTMSEAGELSGFKGLEQGHGIEVVPYLKLKRLRTHEPRDALTKGNVGGDINWRITPQLMGSLTVNTDFAETEADLRRVNLTRFPITFPEKRDFFLEDSNQFQFGWDNAFGGFGGGGPTLAPYFSRRIGLSPEGEEIPLNYGGRLAGRVEEVDLGILAVRTDDLNREDIPGGSLLVARPAWRVNEELTLGGILTHGNPSSRDNNVVAGSDLRYSSTDTLPGLWTVNAYFMRSDDEESDALGSAQGIRSSLATSNWYFALDHIYAQKEFMPALGFVRRPGERRFASQIQWSPRPDSGPVRKYEFSVDPTYWTQSDGTVISKTIVVEPFRVEWNTGDEFYLNYIFDSDRLDEEFEPVDDAVIPAGSYHWHTFRTGYEFSSNRPLAGRINVNAGSWYNGRRYQYTPTATWHPSACFELGLNYNETQVRLPDDNFTVRVESINVNYDFSANLRLETLVQADNVSDSLGLQSRLHWIHQDGRELFFVINSSWVETEDNSIVPEEQDLVVKVEYAIRF